MIFVLLACVFSCAFPLDIPMDEVDDDDDEASSNKARDVRKLTREKRRGIEYAFEASRKKRPTFSFVTVD
jgi:hypothetical protein